MIGKCWLKTAQFGEQLQEKDSQQFSDARLMRLQTQDIKRLKEAGNNSRQQHHSTLSALSQDLHFYLQAPTSYAQTLTLNCHLQRRRTATILHNNKLSEVLLLIILYLPKLHKVLITCKCSFNFLFSPSSSTHFLH